MIVLERVARIYAEVADLPEGAIFPKTGLRDPDWIDSLDLAEFYMACEEEFSVEIPDRLCLDFQTIGDVVDHIELQLREQNRNFTTRTGRA